MFLLIFSFAYIVTSQPPRPGEGGADQWTLEPVQPEGRIFNSRERSVCSGIFRTLDGTCTNSRSSDARVWGSAGRPQFSYFGDRDTSQPMGSNLPSPRLISNIISKQDGNIFDERHLSEITTFFGQFIDHTLVTSPLEFKEPFDIPLPEGETLGHFTQKLPFFRSQRVRIERGRSIERPQNSISSVVDLSNVYGASKDRNDRLRTGTDGLMKTSKGNLLPLNSGPKPLFNAPNTNADFFLAGDHRSNEHPVLTALHTLFLREHNSIAVELKELFPEFSGNDQLLFDIARKINEAQWQKIVFEEWYPALIGQRLPPYRGFKKRVETTVSVTFSTAAFRVGHTLVGNMVNRLGPGNSKMASLPLTATFFRSASTIRKTGGIDPFLRGAINNRAQKVDLKVVDALRDFLFMGVEGEDDNLDLVALNLQRGRDHGVPTYNEIRARFRKFRARTFRDISKDPDVQDKLQEAYGTPDRVEAWPGLMAESHPPHSSLGHTLIAVFHSEFKRLRDGDRFFFRANGLFSEKLLNKVSRLQALYEGQNTFRDIILRNTNIKESELPEKIFFV